MRNWIIIFLAGLLSIFVVTSPSELPQGLKFNRNDYRHLETKSFFEDVDRDGVRETLLIVYQHSDKPSMIARFYRNSRTHNAYWLAVDLDNNDRGDFSITDINGNGYLDMETIKCYENCLDVMESIEDIENGIFNLLERV